MSAVGFAMVAVGAMLVYAGMTGDSLPGAIRQIVRGGNAEGAGFGQGNGGGGAWGTGGGAPSPSTEAQRDAAQTRRPAQA